ncbi:hypothetical protein ACLQ2C_36610 [Streptomyces sp. DT73]|uniref:hypothetical protein n=1 Tax=Streptomyces sp. DT73 TaxID=3393420 RepID=UPI003CF0C5DE
MELTAIPFVLDGYLTADTRPGERPGTASWRLTCSAGVDYRVDEAVIPCSTVQPQIADALLTELQPGDLLRVSGHLTLPTTAGGALWLDADTLEVLWQAPPPPDDDGDTISAPGEGADQAVAVLAQALAELARTAPVAKDNVRVHLSQTSPAKAGVVRSLVLPPALAHKLADYVTTMACHLDMERPDGLALDADTLADLTDLFDGIDPEELQNAVLGRTPPERRAAVISALDDMFPDDRDPEDLEP